VIVDGEIVCLDDTVVRVSTTNPNYSQADGRQEIFEE